VEKRSANYKETEVTKFVVHETTYTRWQPEEEEIPVHTCHLGGSDMRTLYNPRNKEEVYLWNDKQHSVYV